jgi:matrixin
LLHTKKSAQFGQGAPASPTPISATANNGHETRATSATAPGGTRGPLHTHLLIREHVNKNSERESLELVVHELGHFLGAVHSPEQNTVMRTILGDRQARDTRFRVVFDPLNTMAMCLVSQELAARPEVRFRQLTPPTRAELRAIYADLARAIPNDPAARQYLQLVQPN